MGTDLAALGDYLWADLCRVHCDILTDTMNKKKPHTKPNTSAEGMMWGSFAIRHKSLFSQLVANSFILR